MGSAFRRTRVLVTVAVVACVILAGVAVRGQQRAATQAPTLTPQDYIDIQQLVSSYAYGLDGNTDNGATYANLFAPGGVFGRPRTEGRENLAALANTQPRGANYVRHFITNHVIEPSPGGAIGREYTVIIDIGENGSPGRIALGGRYDDEYVKTPQGWKFKTRTFTPSRVDVQPPASAPPPAAERAGAPDAVSSEPGCEGARVPEVRRCRRRPDANSSCGADGHHPVGGGLSRCAGKSDGTGSRRHSGSDGAICARPRILRSRGVRGPLRSGDRLLREQHPRRSRGPGTTDGPRPKRASLHVATGRRRTPSPTQRRTPGAVTTRPDRFQRLRSRCRLLDRSDGPISAPPVSTTTST